MDIQNLKKRRTRELMWDSFEHIESVTHATGRVSRYRCRQCHWQTNAGVTVLRKHWETCSVKNPPKKHMLHPELAGM